MSSVPGRLKALQLHHSPGPGTQSGGEIPPGLRQDPGLSGEEDRQAAYQKQEGHGAGHCQVSQHLTSLIIAGLLTVLSPCYRKNDLYGEWPEPPEGFNPATREIPEVYPGGFVSNNLT